VRWNAPWCEPALAAAAGAAGAGGVDALVSRLEAMTAQLGLPTRLGDVGVRRESLGGVAEHVLADVAVRTNPRPVSTVDDVVEVLDAAF
jgi:alcohol dehydrogenase class IV